MDINRNQYFMIGLVVLLLGLQFRAVNSYVLNTEATHFLAKRAGSDAVAAASDLNMFASPTPGPAIAARKVLHPPEWSGWCLLSVGSVLMLHSLAMRRPDRI